MAPTKRRGQESTGLMTIAAFQTSTTSTETNEQRRQKGRSHTSAVLVYWLATNRWSHPNFEVLATWALNESSALHPSQLSHLRNAKTKLMGVKCLDALGQVNLAVWAWQNQKKDLLKVLGCGSITPQVKELIEHAEVLMNPHTGLPLDQAAFMSIYLGYMTLPDVVNGPEGDPQFQEIVNAFGKYIVSVLDKKKIGMGEASEMLTKATGNAELAEHMCMAAIGLKPFDATALTTQFPAVCKALTSIDGVPRDPTGVVDEIRQKFLA